MEDGDSAIMHLPTRLPPVQIDAANSMNLAKVIPEDPSIVLGPLYGSLLKDLAMEKGKHPMMGVLPAVCIAAGIVGPGLRIRPHEELDWAEPLIVWGTSVAATGSGKTPVLKELIVALECTEFNINQALTKLRMPSIKLQAHSKTYEHLKQTLKESADKVAIFVADELVSQLASVGQYKSGAGADADLYTLLEMRGGGRLIDSTIGRGDVVVEVSHVIYTGGMQPGKACEYLSRKSARDSGLEGRFAMLVVPSQSKTPAEILAQKRAAAGGPIHNAFTTPPAVTTPHGQHSGMQLVHTDIGRIPAHGLQPALAATSAVAATSPAAPSEATGASSSSGGSLAATPAASNPQTVPGVLMRTAAAVALSAQTPLQQGGDPFAAVPNSRLEALADLHTAMLRSRISAGTEQRKATASTEMVLATEGISDAAADLINAYSSSLASKVADARAATSKRQRRLARPTLLLSGLFTELLVITRTIHNGSLVPAEHMLVLDTVPDTELSSSAYDLFNTFTELVRDLVSKMEQRGLGDRSGVVNKLSGTLLQICGVLLMVETAARQLMSPDQSTVAAQQVPTTVNAQTLLCGMDLLRVSTWQRFMLLDDEATLQALATLWPHLTIMPAEVTFSKAVPGEEQQSDEGMPAVRRIPTAWRQLVKVALTAGTGVKKAKQQQQQATDHIKNDKMRASHAPTDFLGDVKIQQELYAFSLTKQALTNSKILNSPDIKNHEYAKHLHAKLKQGELAEYALLIAAGKAGEVLQAISHKFADDAATLKLLNVQELSADLPAIGRYVATKKYALLEKSTFADAGGDLIVLYKALQNLRSDLHVYGIDLGSYYVPLLQLWNAAQSAWNAMQQTARDISIHNAAADQHMQQLQDALSAGLVNDRALAIAQQHRSGVDSRNMFAYVGSGIGVLGSGSGRGRGSAGGRRSGDGRGIASE